MKSLTVKVDERLYRELDRHVRQTGRTKNGLIVALLKSYLGRSRGLTGRPLAHDHPYWQLVGSVEDGAGVSENVDELLASARARR